MKSFWLTFVISLISIASFSQTFKTVTIVPQRNHYLNGGLKASFGGQSRAIVKIDLPPNTINWYYSFTTSEGVSGTQPLNLGLQVAAAVASGGATALTQSQIKVPPGSGTIEVFLIDAKYGNAFKDKDDENWKYYRDVSVSQSKQALQYVDAKYGNSFYLALRSTSKLDGINVFIEAVAVTQEVDTESDKGELYGDLGWKAFERGELEKCLEFSSKALTFNPNLTWVKFNIALAHLAQNNENCIDEYIEALATNHNDKNPKAILVGALNDLDDLVKKYHYSDLKYLKDVKELVQSEINKF